MVNLDQLYQLFKEKAEAISARVYRAATLAEAQKQIAHIIDDLKAQKVVAARSRLVELMNLKQFSVEFDNLRQNAADADLGISEFNLAVAQTGTLAQDATNVDARLVSMLPPAHLALIYTRRLVPDMVEALEALRQKTGEVPAYLAFVSGPSRTADIERVLTIGVHGPGKLFILFIDEGGEPIG